MPEESRSLNSLVIADYLLVISPHEELWNEIMKIKKSFAEKYSCPLAIVTKPHLTLIRFKQYEVMEKKIVSSITRIANCLSPFKIELKDFGSFPSHTIYINVTSKVQILNTVKEFRSAQRLMKFDNDNKPYFITEPHLTIARKLLPWQYEKAWEMYQYINFKALFMVNNLVLLRRRQDNKAYGIILKAELKNLPELARQGQLFNI